MQEGYMMKSVVVAGLLVGNKSGDKPPAVFSHGEQRTQYAIFRNRFGMKTAAQIGKNKAAVQDGTG